MTDRELGIEAIRFFYDYCRENFSDYKTISFQNFLDAIDEKASWFLSGLGLGIDTAGVSDAQVEEAMINIAHQTEGKIPKNLNQITQAVSEASQDYDFSFWSNVAGDTITDLVYGAQKVGDAVIEGGSGLLTLTRNAKLVLAGVAIISLYYVFGTGRKGKSK